MEFDQLIAPLRRQEFLGTYWGKSFIHISGQKGRFSHLLTWDELSAILEQHRLTPPRLKLSQNGRAVDADHYMTPAKFGVPRLDSGKLALCLAEGASLILDDAQELAPRVGALCQVMEDVLHTDAYANLYASWHGQNAFDLHWDPQDSIVVQLSGRKRWKIYEPTRLSPLQDDIEAAPRPTGQPVWDGTLEDGDAVHIPRGWWHIAFPDGAPSLHLTIGTTPPHGLNFLGWVIGKLRSQAGVRANLPSVSDAEGQVAQLRTLRELVSDAMGDSAIADFLREWESNIRPHPYIRLPEAPYEQRAAITGKSKIRLSAPHSLYLARNGENFSFNANGISWVIPESLVPALEMLRNGRTIPVAQLCAKLPDQAANASLLKSLGILARAGIVAVESENKEDGS
jgi:ribosomal protein L16 Arg81 hydroxylase